jgi:hypothetical protein
MTQFGDKGNSHVYLIESMTYSTIVAQLGLDVAADFLKIMEKTSRINRLYGLELVASLRLQRFAVSIEPFAVLTESVALVEL